jgi:hypothetical protein
MKQKVILGLTLLLTATLCFAQKTKIDSLFSDFKQASFYGKIEPAKMKLESLQKEIIPHLIELLNDTSFVKLTGTADLIYPGATEFYGHGYFIPYDIDWISVRAGWLLEDLTFMNFGYKTSGVDDTTLFNLMKDSERYKEYLKKGTYDLEWKNKPTREKLIEFRKILSQNAKNWWQTNQGSWTRLSAIKDALQSNDENRLGEVLQFLRYGETRCDSLNTEVYLKDIKPLVVNLKQTQYQSVKEQVDLLLREDLNYWTRKMKELDKQNGR